MGPGCATPGAAICLGAGGLCHDRECPWCAALFGGLHDAGGGYRHPMQMPERTAGSALPGLGGALSFSVLAHALVLASYCYLHRNAQAPACVRARPDHLMVTLMPAARPGAPAPASPQAPMHRQALAVYTPAPPPQRPTAPAPAPALAQIEPAPQPEAEAPVALPSPAPVPAPAASTEPAGARFTNLFAPILSEPLGRPRWGRRHTAMAQPNLPAEALQQQAALALRSQLQQGLEAWRSAQLVAQASFDCEAQVDYPHAEGRVQCQDPRDTATLSALLQAVLRPLARHDGANATTCLRLTPTQITEQACPSTPPPGSP